jgi:O-antigen/teichoic acid export membrane protein
LIQNAKKLAKSGIKWAALSSLTGAGLSAVTTFGLAVILGSKEYGYLALISTLISFSSAMAQMGMTQAIIQEDNLTHKDINTVFWGNFTLGVIIGALIYIFANQIASFLGDPDITSLVRSTSIIFLIHSMSRISAALLQRDLRIKELETANITEITIGSITKISLAFIGFGAFSYVYGQIIGILILNLLLYWFYKKTGTWRLGLNFSLQSAKKLYGFGAYVTAKSIVNNIGKNIDVVIISRIIGVESTGIYHLGKQIIERLVLIISQVVSRVSFPYFSMMRRSILESNYKSISKTYLRLTALVSFFAFPFFMSIAFLGPLIIELIFSQEWSSAGIILSILSIKAIIDVLSAGFASSIIYSFGKASIPFYVDLFMTPIRVFILWLSAVYFGIEGVAFAFAFSVLIKAGILQHFVNKLITIEWIEYLKILFRQFTITLMVIGIVALVNIPVSHLLISKLSFTIFNILVFLVFISIAIFIFEKPRIIELKYLLFK